MLKAQNKNLAEQNGYLSSVNLKQRKVVEESQAVILQLQKMTQVLQKSEDGDGPKTDLNSFIGELKSLTARLKEAKVQEAKKFNIEKFNDNIQEDTRKTSPMKLQSNKITNY